MSGGSAEEALKRALRFLSFRDHTEEELRVRLARAGFAPKTVEATLHRLSELHYIDDERFARHWVFTRAEDRGYGRARIARELLDKGLPHSLIEPILDEAATEEKERKRARALLEKRFKGKDLNDRRTLHQAGNFLLRQGYSDALVAELLHLPDASSS